MSAPDLVLPSGDDAFVRGATGLIGGPPGRHARLLVRRFWSPVRIIVALTLLTCVLGFAQKSPCRDGAFWQHEQQYTRLCYTDLLPLYSSEGLADGKVPYLQHDVEYPVLIGGLMHLSASVVKPLPKTARPTAFVDVTILLLTACALVVAVCTAHLAGRRVWDAAAFALAPGLLLGGFINWDLAAAALLALGMLAWARRKPAWAGAAIGLGGATKLYPLVLLLPLALVCVRAGRLRALLVALAGTVGAWLAVNLPVYLASPHGWSYFYRFSEQRGADWGSLFYFLQYLRGPLDASVPDGGSPRLLNVAVSGLLLVGLLGVCALTLLARRRPRLPQVVFLTLVVFCLSNKVYSPQYVIWLLPLAVLARPRWGGLLMWQAGEALGFFGIWYYLIGIDKPGQGIGAHWYFAALLLRDGLLLALAVLVVRDVLWPERDVVRAGGQDDPAGGVLDGAPDRFVLTTISGRMPASAPV